MTQINRVKIGFISQGIEIDFKGVFISKHRLTKSAEIFHQRLFISLFFDVI
jgi:hypothetical protein